MKKYYELHPKTVHLLKEIEGPIVVFGAGGFIGINFLNSLLLYREDVYGISQDHLNNWRFMATGIPFSNLHSCDITQKEQIKDLLQDIKPKTVFNLSAYGAYSKQKEYEKIYQTNFIASVDIIEILKEIGFSAFIQAGSSSEYGLNSNQPIEETQLIPNSHYAVSKTAIYHAIKYYGEIEKLPVIHLRLYSAYGPWEEPDRLMPVLLSKARKNTFPSLVDPDISRDFIHVKDVSEAMIASAAKLKPRFYGHAFNVGTGRKTTISDLAYLVKDIQNINDEPQFGKMTNRKWDLSDWFANPELISKELGWKSRIWLKTGIKETIQWQKEVDFDNAFWNWTKK